MKQFSTVLLSVMVGSLALTGCAGNQMSAMQARLNQQEQQIRMLNSQLSGVQPAQADTWAQVQSLRQEMSSVRGQIDDFNNATASVGGLSGLAQRVNRHDAALRSIGNQFAMDLQLDEPAPAADPSAVPGAEQGESAPVAPAPVNVTTPPAEAGQSAPAAQPQTAAQSDIAKALYDAGIQAFNARNYSNALKSFSDFTDTYPKHRLISNAWFWRGECQYQLGEFPAAALDYEQVISKFPKSGKLASAYLKQGMCFIKAGKKEAAKIRLQELVKKFPKSPEATRAKQLMKDNKM